MARIGQKLLWVIGNPRKSHTHRMTGPACTEKTMPRLTHMRRPSGRVTTQGEEQIAAALGSDILCRYADGDRRPRQVERWIVCVIVISYHVAVQKIRTIPGDRNRVVVEDMHIHVQSGSIKQKHT